jgi:hypothetical protein
MYVISQNDAFDEFNDILNAIWHRNLDVLPALKA